MLPSGSIQHSTRNRVEGPPCPTSSKFPRAASRRPEPVQPAAPAAARLPHQGRRPGPAAGLVKFVWVATVLVWPVLKWVLAIITFFQFVRMLYHWNTPACMPAGRSWRTSRH